MVYKEGSKVIAALFAASPLFMLSGPGACHGRNKELLLSRSFYDPSLLHVMEAYRKHVHL